jgi:hypothetical protein
LVKYPKPFLNRQKSVDTRATNRKTSEARAKEMKIIATTVKENFQLMEALSILENRNQFIKRLPVETHKTL